MSWRDGRTPKRNPHELDRQDVENLTALRRPRILRYRGRKKMSETTKGPIPDMGRKVIGRSVPLHEIFDTEELNLMTQMSRELREGRRER